MEDIHMPVLTYFKDSKDKRDYTFNMNKMLGSDIAAKIVNSRRAKAYRSISYRKYMSPVKNQGNLGSCVGFAVTALKEFHENIEYLYEQEQGGSYKREKEHYDLSEQWTYWNAKKIDPWGPSVEGTSIRFALKVLHKIGCPPEEGWKYTDNKINIGEPESWSHLIARWNTIESYWRLKNLKHILRSLRNIGPVVAGVGCYQEIFNPEPDGYVPYPKYPQYCYGGHAILLCGINAKTKRVLFKNSWGTDWGDGGYGWLSYNYLRSFCWDAWATKDSNVIRAMLAGKVSL
jgi:C1A family cysteine protease